MTQVLRISLLFTAVSGLISISSWATKPNESAAKGGSFILNLGGEPPTVHPIASTDLYASNVQSFVCEGLLSRDPQTYEWRGRLADKWEISKDKKTFTFHIRENAVFHDGQPVTAEDVKFSFDAIFNPTYEAAHLRPYYEGLTKVEVVDKQTVKFTARDLYFKNFDSAAGLTIIPKHVYSDVAKSKKMTRTLSCSGPYKLKKFARGQMIQLEKFDKWWGNTDKSYAGAYNFKNITLRFYKDETVTLERAKKGDLDYIDLKAESFVKKAVGAPWGKSLFKHKVENDAPKAYNFIGWNFRKDLFKDKNVRVALAHLLNRGEMNQKFRYNMSDLATGAVYLRSEYAPSVTAIPYDTAKAFDLLKKAGWADTDKDGVIEKTVNGQKVPFRFSLMYANKDTEKYWTLYKEDLKKAGIDMELKFLEWNSFLKILDEGSFDAITLGWGGGSVEPDPKQIWHSASAVPGGSNFIAYKNDKVDQLIDKGRLEATKEARVKLFRDAYKLIAEDAPYAFLFNDKFAFYANSKKVDMPAETFRFEVGTDYWWVKP